MGSSMYHHYLSENHRYTVANRLEKLSKKFNLLCENLSRVEVRYLDSGLQFHSIPMAVREAIPEPARKALRSQFVIREDGLPLPDLCHWIEGAREHRDLIRYDLLHEDAEEAEEHLEVMNNMVYQARLDVVYVENELEDFIFPIDYSDAEKGEDWCIPKFGDEDFAKFEQCMNFILALPETLHALKHGFVTFEQAYNMQTGQDEDRFLMDGDEETDAIDTPLPSPTESEFTNAESEFANALNEETFGEGAENDLEQWVSVNQDELPSGPPNTRAASPAHAVRHDGIFELLVEGRLIDRMEDPEEVGIDSVVNGYRR